MNDTVKLLPSNKVFIYSVKQTKLRKKDIAGQTKESSLRFVKLFMRIEFLSRKTLEMSLLRKLSGRKLSKTLQQTVKKSPSGGGGSQSFGWTDFPGNRHTLKIVVMIGLGFDI